MTILGPCYWKGKCTAVKGQEHDIVPMDKLTWNTEEIDPKIKEPHILCPIHGTVVLLHEITEMEWRGFDLGWRYAKPAS